jgi:hypothetical protein
MPQSRQFAAIMFTDIVGYTTLIGNDEHKVFELLKKTGNYKNQSSENSMYNKAAYSIISRIAYINYACWRQYSGS